MKVSKCSICPYSKSTTGGGATSDGFRPVSKLQSWVEHLASRMHQRNMHVKYHYCLRKEMPLEEDRFVISGLNLGMTDAKIMELALWLAEFGDLVDFMYMRGHGFCIAALQATGVQGRGKCVERLESILEQTMFQFRQIKVYRKSSLDHEEWNNIFQHSKGLSYSGAGGRSYNQSRGPQDKPRDGSKFNGKFQGNGNNGKKAGIRQTAPPVAAGTTTTPTTSKREQEGDGGTVAGNNGRKGKYNGQRKTRVTLFQTVFGDKGDGGEGTQTETGDESAKEGKSEEEASSSIPSAPSPSSIEEATSAAATPPSTPEVVDVTTAQPPVKVEVGSDPPQTPEVVEVNAAQLPAEVEVASAPPPTPEVDVAPTQPPAEVEVASAPPPTPDVVEVNTAQPPAQVEVASAPPPAPEVVDVTSAQPPAEVEVASAPSPPPTQVASISTQTEGSSKVDDEAASIGTAEMISHADSGNRVGHNSGPTPGPRKEGGVARKRCRINLSELRKSGNQ